MYTRADALFDAWVTGNWGEDSIEDEEPDEGPPMCRLCGQVIAGGEVCTDCWAKLPDEDKASQGEGRGDEHRG